MTSLEVKMVWGLVILTVLSVSLAIRWAYVASKAVKTLDKFGMYNGLVRQVLTEISAGLDEVMPKVPLVNSLSLYCLQEKLVCARKLFEDKEIV